jgi:hypothetical protein
MKAQIRAKTTIRGRDWADLRRPDEKNTCRGPRRACEWRCSKLQHQGVEVLIARGITFNTEVEEEGEASSTIIAVLKGDEGRTTLAVLEREEGTTYVISLKG